MNRLYMTLVFVGMGILLQGCDPSAGFSKYITTLQLKSEQSPEDTREHFDRIVQIVDTFCQQHAYAPVEYGEQPLYKRYRADDVTRECVISVRFVADENAVLVSAWEMPSFRPSPELRASWVALLKEISDECVDCSMY